jgi:hypothetical protein
VTVRPSRWLAIGVPLAFPPIFLAWFVAAEEWVYFWDYSNYWIRLADLTSGFRSSPVAAITRALESVSFDKYNDLAALPLLPAALVFGNDRVTYVVSIAVVFGLPTMLLLAALMRRLFARDVAPSSSAGPTDLLPVVVALRTAALLPQVWFPVTVGYLDLVGCIPILAVFLVLARDPTLARPRASFAVGLMLGLLPLLRRWYAFFPATFVATSLSMTIGSAILARRRGAWDATATRRRVAASLTLLLGVALAALPLAGPVAESVFLRDHLSLQAPYLRTPGLTGALWRVWTYFGSVTLGLAATGFVLAVRIPGLRRFALFLAAQAALLVCSFNLVQTFGENHFYLLIPTLLVFECLAIVSWLRGARSERQRRFRGGALSVLLVLNFSMVLVPVFSASGLRTSTAMAAIFGRAQHAPWRRQDVGELGRLVRAVAAARSEAGGGSVYVLASSPRLNPDILRNAHLSLRELDLPDLRSAVSPGVHVDRRDGFPSDLLVATVVVTATPPQIHLAPEEQQVILVPAREIAAGTTIGRSFRTLPDRFQLEGGVTARVHVRERPLAPEDVHELRELLAGIRSVLPADAPKSGSDGDTRFREEATTSR